jgi:dynactin complex subunit
MKELCDGFEVGMRCSVEPGDKRGEVKYVGPSQGGVPLGWWVGVQYDEPVGKNDGTSKGERCLSPLPHPPCKESSHDTPGKSCVSCVKRTRRMSPSTSMVLLLRPPER